jgi:hypothetical protein
MADDQFTLGLMSPPGDLPPAWRRLDELIQEKWNPEPGTA